MNNHQELMNQALDLARRGMNSVSPNPMVGCLIVKDQNIIGAGYHQRRGEHHAEIFALQQAGIRAKGATAYITLEPCCHYGATPPCVEALIKAGISQVYIACLDPNPLVAGKGIAALQAANINVNFGLGETEARNLNQIFFHYIQHKRPFVVSKWAMSLDGKTITQADDSKEISNPQSKLNTHQLRQQLDAILIGATTAKHDDPLLTVRLTETTKHPLRIILSSDGNLPLNLKLFSSALPAKTLVATTAAISGNKLAEFTQRNIEVMILPATVDQQVDLISLLDALGKREISSLLVEGGMSVHESFFKQGLVNQLQVFLAPIIIGKMPKKQSLKISTLHQNDTDYIFTANIEV